MKYLYLCTKCKKFHGGQTPAVEQSFHKLCDHCKPTIKTDSQYARIAEATLITGAPIFSVTRGEYL